MPGPLARQLLAALILFAALSLTWLAYAPGLGGSLHFDDPTNLGGLAGVHEFTSALNFITSGTAGPLGRPIALASFAMQASAWPASPEVFLQTNILLHLLNGVLVTWLLYLLGRARGRDGGHSAVVAAAGGGLWLLLPILASSSLLIVQRMTLLSGTFALLGAIAYLYARRLIGQRPRLALAGMSLALLTGATLSALSKENGVLLFLFILVMEWTLLPRPANLGAVLWRAWFSVMLTLPALVLLAYLVMRIPYSEGTVLMRDFTAGDRLLTQAHILWQYLYHAFLPNPAALGPFHDDYRAVRLAWTPANLLAVGGWFAVIGAAVALRRRAPLFTFAVAWYLAGHALESTTIPLELYFEHRNYLPLVGPLYALVAYALEATGKRWQTSAVALAAYAFVLAATLFSLTSLWGAPSLAAEMWYIHKPESTRATTYLAQRLQQDGDLWTARRVLRQSAESNPNDYGARLQVLQLSCRLDRDKDHGQSARDLEGELATAPYQSAVFQTLARLYELVLKGECHGLESDGIYRLAARLAENPAYQSDRLLFHNLHVLMARIGIERRDLVLTMTHLEQALKAHHSMPTLYFVVQTLNSAGLYDASRDLVAQAQAHRPANPIRATGWDRQLQQLWAVLDPAQQHQVYPMTHDSAPYPDGTSTGPQ